ncbi:MAG: alpha/beta hydrolase, partial [Verrucomicrobiaceae bacterium]|nr:alpha/beta hydrolase [Verrucomicrobiaceae bacterium]
ELMHEVGQRLGLHFVAMDRPGIGNSDFQPGRRLLDWPVLIAELADHLGWPRFHVFGVSGGGPYALVIAHSLPERVLSTSVIGGAPPLRELGTQDLFIMYRLILALRRKAPWLLSPLFKLGAFMSTLPPDRFPMSLALKALNAEDRAVLMHPVTGRIVGEGYRESVRNGVPSLQADGDIYTSDWGLPLKDIRVPVHFWHGKADHNIPWTYAQKIAAQIPGSITHWTETDGHYSMAISRVEEIVRTAVG